MTVAARSLGAVLALTLGALCAPRIPVGAQTGDAIKIAVITDMSGARSIGYDVARFKLIAFVMSGTMSGLAGGLYALNNRLVGLEVVDWHTSGKVVMMTILGGIGTLYGAIAGAGLFESLEYYISKTALGDKTNIVMGTIFAVVILAARRGIVGEILAAIGTGRRISAEAEPEPTPAEIV